MNNELPEDFDAELPVYEAGKSVATRSSSGDAINALAKNVPSFFGGHADLAGSNKTTIKGAGDSLQKLLKAVIFGLVYVNLQWVLH